MNQIIKTGTTEQSVQHFNTEENPQAPANKIEDTLIHEAKIITPQPYGVYALCKILEHFQIN
jgi:hypothetical protein